MQWDDPDLHWDDSRLRWDQPFPAATKYWSADKPFMLNFRVKNLDRLVAQLRKDGIKVDVDPMMYPNGRFAALEDPEGNPIQLWESKGPTR